VTELEVSMLKRAMGEVIAILRKYTEVERFGETKELHAYEDLLATWHMLFPEPSDG
jgi:hypothetical protein